MTKAVVKLVSLVMVLMLIFSTALNLSAVDLSESSTATTYKISDELKSHIENLNDDDFVTVYLWLEDIDHDEVDKAVDKKIGISADDMTALSNSITEEYCRKSGISTYSLLTRDIGEVSADDWMEKTKTSRAEVNRKVDNYISAKRTESSNMYNSKNTSILNKLNIDEENIIFQSQYSPLQIVSLSKEKIYEVANNSKVESISLYQELEIEEMVESRATSDVESGDLIMDCHKAAVEADSLPSIYDGTGIKVGMLEPSTPAYWSCLDNANMTRLSEPIINLKYNWHEHAANVARIMVGNTGMIPEAQLYCASTEYYLNNGFQYPAYYYKAIEMLLLQNVSIINSSWGRTNWKNHSYDDDVGVIARWTDHVSTNHNVTIVVSAGNYKEEKDPITNQVIRSTHYVLVNALAYNVITVGNLNDNNTAVFSDDTINPDSCYMYGNNCFKPDVIAPGTDFKVGTTSISSGTSYSAPIVTGVATYMMQANSTLKTNPIAVKAILLASCNRKVGGYALDNMTFMQGAGVVSAKNCLDIIANSQYVTGRVSNQSASNTFTVIDWANTGRESFALAWEKNNSIPSGAHVSATLTEYPMVNFNLNVSTTTGASIGNSNLTNSSTELVNKATTANTFSVNFSTADTFINQSVRYALAWWHH